MDNYPLITVLLPVYNCEKYFFESVQSILSQTYKHFELLIIDDCSTDKTLEICKSFKDERIVLIEKEKNSGYTDSLNYGISIAKGKYIARMDGDDISLPERFEKQINFLEQNPTISLCGTAIQIIGTNKVLKHPLKHDEIKVNLCKGSSFFHPTVMGKTQMFRDNLYDKSYEPAEDYELWTRLIFKYNVANLDNILLLYRVHENQVSVANNSIQSLSAYKSQLKMFNHLGIEKYFSQNDLDMVFRFQISKSINDYKITLKVLKKLRTLNIEKNIYKLKEFSALISKFEENTLKNFLSMYRIASFKTLMFLLRNTSFSVFYKLLKYKMFKRIN